MGKRGKGGKGGKGDKGGKIAGHGRTGGGNAKPSMRKKSKLVVTFDADKRKCVGCFLHLVVLCEAMRWQEC